MGSSGSGSFSDYSNSKPSGSGGGASGNDLCRQAFNCELEEVSQCEFYSASSDVPAAGTVLSLIHEKRIFAVTADGTKVGALPTMYNYLAGCMKDGITYVGVVTASGLVPLPTVTADFTAQ